jgi:hypothetical protein
MGSMHAEEYAAHDKQFKRNGDAGLAAHLQGNHYPPVPLSMVPIAKRAIKHANAGRWDANVTLPEGILYRGSKKAPVHAIIDSHHLHPWLNNQGEE